jgi:hypothetical protein
MGILPVELLAPEEKAKKVIKRGLWGNLSAVFFMRAESHGNISKLLQNCFVFVKQRL